MLATKDANEATTLLEDLAAFHAEADSLDKEYERPSRR